MRRRRKRRWGSGAAWRVGGRWMDERQIGGFLSAVMIYAICLRLLFNESECVLIFPFYYLFRTQKRREVWCTY